MCMDNTMSGDQAQPPTAADGARLVPLKRHPSSASKAVRGVFSNVRAMPDGGIAFTYLLEADLSRLRIPPRVSGRRVDGLWQHTCFEAFVAVTGTAGYREFNFAPSGDWAVYAFSDYREGIPVTIAQRPDITVYMGEDRLQVEAIVAREHVPQEGSAAGWRVALSAVIEDDAGVLTYWALEHPPGKPDFHHPDGFALALPPATASANIGAADGGRE
jgi:hypothetical protein